METKIILDLVVPTDLSPENLQHLIKQALPQTVKFVSMEVVNQKSGIGTAADLTGGEVTGSDNTPEGAEQQNGL